MTDIYRNLTKSCWSLREGGRVVAHVAAAALAHCSLHASEPSRLRYLRTRHRTVHAWARGILTDTARPADAVRLHYRPATAPGFRTPSGALVRKARLAVFENDGMAWIAGGEDAPILDTERSPHGRH